MKLVMCLACGDVFNLDVNLKECKCGRTEGRYLGKINAYYKGDTAIPLELDNADLAKAINDNSIEKSDVPFKSFVVSRDSPTFIKRTY